MNSPLMRAHFASFRCRTPPPPSGSRALLALRLRDAGVAPEVICEYVGVDEVALDGVYRIAEAKLNAEEDRRRCREPCQ
jgi:hypothetical protein